MTLDQELERQQRLLEQAGWREVPTGEAIDYGPLSGVHRPTVFVRDDLPGWSFDVEEVSMGHYRAIGTDGAGHRVERHEGESSDGSLSLLNAAAEDARQVARRSGRP